MSSTTTDATTDTPVKPAPTPRTATTPEPPTALTRSTAAVLTALADFTEPVTVVEIALAASVGRSTAARALTSLEQQGLAVRTPGDTTGHRSPELWHATPTSQTGGEAIDDEPTNASTANTTPDSAPISTDPTNEPTTSPAAGATQDPPQDTSLGDTRDADEQGGSGYTNGPVSETQIATGNTQATTTAASPPGDRKRLAPGALRQMVIAHLQAHPDTAFTATAISRTIEKSSGAIANALATLTMQGITEQANEKPRRYQLKRTEPKA